MSPTQTQQQTLGEIARRLDDVFQRYEQIANSLPTTFVSREAFEAYKELVVAKEVTVNARIDAYEHRVAELEDDKKWLWRLVVGAVILALVGLVLSTQHTAKPPSTRSEHASSQAVTQ